MTDQGHKREGYNVVVKVLSQEGFCAAGYEVGDEIYFNNDEISGKLTCIDALTTLMPCVYAMHYGVEFPWQKEDPDHNTIPCPDVPNPVIFEVRRFREDQS